MLTKLIALSSVLSLVQGAKSPYPNLNYTSKVTRYNVPDEMHDGPELFIEDGQCTGVIKRETLCGNFVPLGLSVSLTDRVGYPLISINDDLGAVYITREMTHTPLSCQGRVWIHLKLVCRGKEAPQNRGPLRVSAA